MSWKNPLLYSPEEKLKSDVLIRRTKSIYHLLTPQQRKMHKLIFSTNEPEVGYYCSRKIGKTGSILLMFFEWCWKNPAHITRIVLSNQTQAVDIIEPLILTFISKIIPKDMMPDYKISKKSFIFKNGSVINLNGAHPDNIEKAAGPSCNLMAFDEIAIWEGNVHHALYDILYPQGTLTNMKKVFSCTPPLDVSSYYIQNIHPKLIDKETLVSLTIDESPLMTKEQIESLAAQMGGRDSPEFRRQYLCQLIPSQSLRLTPEFDENRHIIKEELSMTTTWGEVEIPQLYQCYVVADTGTVDNTAVLAGYFDHNLQKLVIIDEFVENGLNLTQIATKILEIKESIEHICYDTEKGIDVIIDAFSVEAKEYREVHGIVHKRPYKCIVTDNIAHLRSAFENDKVLISQSCKRLIWELKNCVWKETITDKKQIARTLEQKHGDAVMALTYMLRAVNWRFRPGKASVNFKLGDYKPNENSFDEQKHLSRVWGDIRRIPSG